MNPPTTGHKDLIRQMVLRASATGVNKVHIILSYTLDKDNPLTCEQKKWILDDFVKDLNFNVQIVCMFQKKTEKDHCGSNVILNPICHLLENENYTKAVLFIGIDRAKSYAWVGTALAKNVPSIPLETVPLERTTNPVSATEIRNLIKADDYSGFIEKYRGSGLDDNKLEFMYSTIKDFYQTNGKKGGKQGKTKKKRRKRITSRKFRRNK